MQDISFCMEKPIQEDMLFNFRYNSLMSMDNYLKNSTDQSTFASNVIDHMISMSVFNYSTMKIRESNNEQTNLSHKRIIRKRRIAIRK